MKKLVKSYKKIEKNYKNDEDIIRFIALGIGSILLVIIIILAENYDYISWVYAIKILIYTTLILFGSIFGVALIIAPIIITLEWIPKFIAMLTLKVFRYIKGIK